LKICFLVWGPFGFRADELAEQIGAERVDLTFLYGPRFFAPLRYLVLSVRTFITLARSNPVLVYAQNPPVFCPMAALLYCKLTRKRLFIDHHSIWSVKTIGGMVGVLISLLEKFVSRNAFANTAPHAVWGEKLSLIRARRVLVVHDHVEKNPARRSDDLHRKYAGEGKLVIASHGGHPLERIEAEIKAVAMTGNVTLAITGPEQKLRHRLEHLGTSERARYLGLLPMEEYLSLKASSDFALNITDEPYTLSHVIFEFVASSLPVISSRQGVVEDVFGDSLLYVDSSDPGEVAEKVELLAGSPALLQTFRRRADECFDRLEESWREEVEALESLIAGQQFRAKALERSFGKHVGARDHYSGRRFRQIRGVASLRLKTSQKAEAPCRGSSSI
jgi:glycosyltransferase involved in cell wall biosynthesis